MSAGSVEEGIFTQVIQQMQALLRETKLEAIEKETDWAKHYK